MKIVHTEEIHGCKVEVHERSLPDGHKAPYYVWIDGECMTQRGRVRARMFGSIETALDAAQKFINQQFGATK